MEDADGCEADEVILRRGVDFAGVSHLVQHRLFVSLVFASLVFLVGSVGAPEADPLPQLHEYDFYVGEFQQVHPTENVTIGTIAFGLSPEGPFTTPGPTIRIREGDTLRVRLHDTAGFSGHTIHWHGIVLPWAMDGMPWMTQELSRPETFAVYTYEWTAVQSGTYWYHCHVDAPVHLDIGMFGVLIIEPKDEGHDPNYDREYTLMLHEMDSTVFALADASQGHPEDLLSNNANPFDVADQHANGARSFYDIMAGYMLPDPARGIAGAQGPRDYYPEWSIRYRPQYDTFMINGKSFPETEPILTNTGEVVRVRLVNAGQLVHTMHLHGHIFTVTHKDGHLLPAPWQADTVLLGPGERYDIYVTADNPGHWDFHDHGGGWGIGGFTSNDHAFPGGMSLMMVYEDWVHPGLPKPVKEGPDHGSASPDGAFVPHHVVP